MGLTKLYLKNKLVVLGAIATIVLGVATLGENSMIDYYCSPTSLFLGVNFSQTGLAAYCSFAVIVSHITGIFLFFLLLAILLDSVKLITINLYKRIVYAFRNRKANIIVVTATVGDEHFVAIKNGGFLLRADNVVVNSHFIFYDKKYNDNLKWSNDSSESNETSIRCMKHEAIHFATISNDKFIVHMARGDEIFPLPEDDPYYVIPLYISGSMSFLGYAVKRVQFEAYEEVIITPDRKIKIRERKF